MTHVLIRRSGRSGLSRSRFPLGALLCFGLLAGQAFSAPTLPTPSVGTPRPLSLAVSSPEASSPAKPKAPAGAPNVVVVLLDDVGFGAAGTFGGPAPTPTLDETGLDLAADNGPFDGRGHQLASPVGTGPVSSAMA